jgi:hypothetical protein
LQISSAIKDIWGTRADSVPFPDPATMKLISSLQDEFRSGTDARVLTDLTPAVFDTDGSVTTLEDLVTFIDDAPEPQHAVIAGFANDAVKSEFASAVAEALSKSSVTAPGPSKMKSGTGRKKSGTAKAGKRK